MKRQLNAVNLAPGTDNSVIKLFLTPDRNYIVTASAELGSSSSTGGLVSCTLFENNNNLSGGSANLPNQPVFAQTITLTGATTGGNISLSCNPDSGAVARNSIITAIQVGALHKS